MFRETEQIPPGLLEVPAHGLWSVLGGPLLIHLRGRREPPLFVSVLLHGNETVGWEAIRRVLRAYQCGGGAQPLPRALSLFIGNVEAAALGLRYKPDGLDYNRVWPGTEHSGHLPEALLMHQVVERMRRRGLFASVDLHNNTGLNPHYACVNRLDPRFLQLATLFSRTVVYFTRPRGVQSLAMAELGPAVTLECGKAGRHHGVDHAAEFIDACLHINALPDTPVPAHDLDVFHTIARVQMDPTVSFGFGESEVDIRFAPDLDALNFRELPAGAAIAQTRLERRLGLEAVDEQGRDVLDRYFVIDGGRLCTRRPVMPSMLTTNSRVIRQDCLCYLMERYRIDSL